MTSPQLTGQGGKPSLPYDAVGVPPTARIEGVDLATEGVLTVNKVLGNARDCLAENKAYAN